MKSFTSIEQSKTLAKILPIESADMFYLKIPNSLSVGYNYSDLPYFATLGMKDNLPAWSLASLLEVLPKDIGRYTKSLYWFDETWHCEYVDEDSEGLCGASANNPIDACVEMIVKLKEKGIL